MLDLGDLPCHANNILLDTGYSHKRLSKVNEQDNIVEIKDKEKTRHSLNTAKKKRRQVQDSYMLPLTTGSVERTLLLFVPSGIIAMRNEKTVILNKNKVRL